ncbi:MAG TPA: hypothetical protein PLU21_01635 [Candidatus Saccharibacteria bacterium]|mgnify:CR=1 FL=1|nr:hypothetical protein [Candidatus Saccharibacteria bacterium]
MSTEFDDVQGTFFLDHGWVEVQPLVILPPRASELGFVAGLALALEDA